MTAPSGSTTGSAPARHDVDVNGWPAIISACVLGTIGVCSFIIQPGLVEGFVAHLPVSEARAVDLVGLEMLGVALATVLVAALGSRIGWRWIVAAGLLTAMAGDLGSALVGDGALFGWLRVVSGLGEGTIISISFTFVGITLRPERNLALYLSLLLTYGAFGLWQLPRFLDAFGLPALFTGFAALSALGLLTLRCVPHHFTADEMGNPLARQLPLTLLAVALAGVLAYNLAQGIAWATLGLVGSGAGLSDAAVANALFLSQVLAIGGALGSVWLATHINGTHAIVVGILGGAASIALLLGHPDALMFTAAVCGFNVLWNFVLPFILGRVCEFETTGRMMSFAVAMQMAGLGGGPLLAAPLLDGKGYRLVELLCVALFVLSLLLLAVPIRAHHRRVVAAGV